MVHQNGLLMDNKHDNSRLLYLNIINLLYFHQIHHLKNQRYKAQKIKVFHYLPLLFSNLQFDKMVLSIYYSIILVLTIL